MIVIIGMILVGAAIVVFEIAPEILLGRVAVWFPSLSNDCMAGQYDQIPKAQLGGRDAALVCKYMQYATYMFYVFGAVGFALIILGSILAKKQETDIERT